MQSSNIDAKRLRVILHADDLGISTHVNDAIFSLMDERKITSASLLANGPAFEDAVSRSRYFPQCSFGAHLNITEFGPLRTCAALGPLLSPVGEFKHFPVPTIPQNALKRAILQEWSAQVQRIQQAGVEITHIDSHHHTHTLLALLPVVKQLCTMHGIHRARIRQTFAAKPFISRWRIDNYLYNWKLRQTCSCVDEFGPFAAFATCELRLPVRTTIELMLHPGHRCYETETRSLASLVNDDFRRTYECITYRELN
jgi:predicted glycoside hydrolase/deacetylase ChbG (UPF0249 family)